MEFKLGASLWGRTAENRSPAQAQEAASDFEKKLGLPTRQPELPADRQLPAHQQSQANSLEWQAAQLLLSARKTAQTGAPAERYAWGSLAGHHLSHVPGFFQESPGIAAPLVATVVVAAPQTARSVPGFTQAPAGIQAEPGANGAPLALGEEPVGVEQGRGAQGPAALGRFFAQHWPERRVLILPRESGAEVLIRDFHLSADEQQVLSRDLRDFMRHSATQLQQIWINGQRVWQQAPTQLSTTKE